MAENNSKQNPLSRLSEAELARLVASKDLSRMHGFAPRTDIGGMALNQEYSRRTYDNPHAERLRYATYREGLDQLQQQGSSPSPFPKDYRPATEEQVRELQSLYDTPELGRNIPEIAIPYAPPVDPTVPPHMQELQNALMQGNIQQPSADPYENFQFPDQQSKSEAITTLMQFYKEGNPETYFGMSDGQIKKLLDMVARQIQAPPAVQRGIDRMSE